MKRLRFPHRSRRGSTMLAVMLFLFVLFAVAGSLLPMVLTERRMTHRHSLRLEARNAAEGLTEYGFSQVITKLRKRSGVPVDLFDPSGSDAIHPPSYSMFAGGNIDAGEMEMVAGRIQKISTPVCAPLYYVDPSSAANADDDFRGMRIHRYDLAILGKATAKDASGTAVSASVLEYVSIRDAPLFAYAIFYNMDLEIQAGGDLVIYGPVHTNGDLYVDGQSENNSTLDFLSKVSVTGGLYKGYKIQSKTAGGADMPDTDEPIRFLGKDGKTLINLWNSKGSYWQDQTMDKSTESETTKAAYKKFENQTYGINLMTEVDGTPRYNPAAFGNYVEDLSNANSANPGRAIIERPLASTETGYNAELEAQKYSRKSGLYIVANATSTSRTGHKPDGTAITIPANSIRAYKKDGTEVVLPGQQSAGITVPSATSAARPVVTIRQDQMYDLRRYDTTNGYNPANTRSSSNAYKEMALDIIEVDMTALKMAVDKTVNGQSSGTYNKYDDTSVSNQSTYKANSTASVTLGDGNTIVNYSSSDWNGAVYIESVDAEAHKSSGVRLINGKGRVASTAPKSDNEGLSIATNDALYVLGHYNADGSISTSGATDSSHVPETNEVPASLAADAITILSQPIFSGTSSSSYQTKGWNDALSLNTFSTNAYSTSWRTTKISDSSNKYDGINTSKKPGASPLSNTSGTYGTATTTKLQAPDTEIAAAMVTGIVPSDKVDNNQWSGGANNYPRMLEYWNGKLAIRGSMVALFESRVATQPWVFRYYSAPDRYWGFNDLFAAGRNPPQTPYVRTFTRVDFKFITDTEYADMKSKLW